RGDGRDRSRRQSLHSIQFPDFGGYSNRQASSSVKPSLRQIAFEGGLSVDGNACTYRWEPSSRARASTSAVAALATPRPWAAGTTDQPTSHTRPPRHSRSQNPTEPTPAPARSTILNMPEPGAA